MRFFPIESEIGRKRPLHFAELLERPFSGSIPSDPEVPFSCNGNFDLVSLFEIESFDDGGGKAYGQAVSPFRNLHNASIDTRLL
jgi:hypothetical protein